MRPRPYNWTEIRREWPVFGMYQRFEAFVALVLTVIISAVILVALYRLIVSVIETLVFRGTSASLWAAPSVWAIRKR